MDLLSSGPMGARGFWLRVVGLGVLFIVVWSIIGAVFGRQMFPIQAAMVFILTFTVHRLSHHAPGLHWLHKAAAYGLMVVLALAPSLWLLIG